METARAVLPRLWVWRLDLIVVSLSFLFPFVLGGPQWLVGTGVNFLLFAAARRNWSVKFMWPAAVLPSLAVLSRGIIFGPFTPFLIYFLPFLWLGNFLLMVTFRWLFDRGVVAVGGVVLAALAKAAFLFLLAHLYFRFHLVPAPFLTSMGAGQFLTALAGGFLVLVTVVKNVPPTNRCYTAQGGNAKSKSRSPA